MSRETDSSSAGAHGSGATAYPSGTPPYGTPMAPGDGVDASRSATQSEERKTETTLTTRIRINIPGSRPIPPVVVRKPVEEEGAVDETDADPQTTASMSVPSVPESPAEPSPAAEEKPTSDWFAPRKSSTAKGRQGGGPANGAASSGSSGPKGANGANGANSPKSANGANGAQGAQGTQGAAPAQSGPGAGAGRPGGPGANGTGGARPTASPGGGVRPGGTKSGLPGAAGAGPVAPGHGGGTGSFDVSEAVAASTAQLPVIDPDDDWPLRENPPPVPDLGFRGPAGPTGGPVTGDGPLVPPPGPAAGRPGPNAPGVRDVPGASGAPGAPGAAAGQRRPVGGLSDDTAVLTPQKPAEPGPRKAPGPRGNVSGQTVTSGVPGTPLGKQNGLGSFAAGAPSDGPLPSTPPKETKPAPSAKPAKKKGRSKLVLLGGGVVVLAGVAYGAGLLMNHSDVPKGTTVLGVDIGGGTRDEAAAKLDAALASRTNKPLRLSIGGKTVALKPEQSGLQVDSKATVAKAAQSDYNPVSVIRSLFERKRVVQPVIPVDVEKLQAALGRVGGGSGAMTEGTIKFESGRAVAVYGKAGKGIDLAASTKTVEQAYRKQVESNTSAPVQVATTTRQPTIANAEVDRMMKEFAEPAMSDRVTVMTDPGHSVLLSPENSLWKFLEVKPVDGKLVESYNKEALKELYGHAFDGVLIARGTGQKTPVAVTDVIQALRPALLGKTATERVAKIDTDPS
ncbi:hypothetical protein NGF19_19650 [Streptomyces sp. RY43-2]|uniref:Peptidoglycan binding domain-containing protein n=1 Tax=Streptomyces macrolidinus TaxID=2952607 RepID=A0ABT0ZHF8_9ACTN|nr:hypothetical protein [Streptomyces macrolidinus]MCN9242987.1 hypothetical protein [Streptomyces macrolidinus]